MSITSDMKKIRKLAKKKGNDLLRVDFSGKQTVSFVYKKISYWYPNMTKAIQGELKRLAGQ